ncbi:protein Lilipod isoform X2 [Chrysoperla carnea]|uniref:protein Lilipod isoform X2 n=1 Tax=Chrysoperla carnea TaxID=189513 RepID=UPI001D077354|nr:protein Lilipod isoform X2 [Chrysoperla carnea]
MDEIEDATDPREQMFHNNVREQIIFMLLFMVLYVSSYGIIRWFRRKEREDYFGTDEDEVTVYRISLWLCTFSLSVAVGAALLLPLSILSNEVLILYPKSYYVKWLNSSLIQGLWNYVFLFSNLSMFVLLPFAYLFTESEGFVGHKKGIMSRVYETFTVLSLLAFIVLGLTYVISALIDRDRSSLYMLFNFWSYYLPFLYSCISFIGVLMLLVCTPLGFVRLFDVVGQFLVKPQFLRDINEDFCAYALEEESVRRRLRHAEQTGASYVSPTPMTSLGTCGPVLLDEKDTSVGLLRLRNGELKAGLEKRLEEIENKRKILQKQRNTSAFQRNLVYPLALLLLLLLTGVTVLMVVQNTLELLIGIKALPLSTRQFTLGISSLSMLGPFGAALEIILILYLIATSYIGLYSAPLMRSVRPRIRQTPFSQVIGNCALVLIFSSALPLLSKILGITNFDLMGDFGRIEWLGNFKIVLLYNLVFATAASLCLINKFTASVRRELYARLVENYTYLTNCVSFILLLGKACHL